MKILRVWHHIPIHVPSKRQNHESMISSRSSSKFLSSKLSLRVGDRGFDIKLKMSKFHTSLQKICIINLRSWVEGALRFLDFILFGSHTHLLSSA
ncbi:hypothetical protein RHMOL_Rhmol05G0119200 [Rhododendron molle]|uniref:Uncharacterized protein n=1 Tax=Rhododendron molle TaxID=49168 RepID=A0ACC0NQE3_RHOML|nr:hypothetical protein RHMOL_Rhmol05G0119200 [Rhododendron molle]